MDDAPQHAETHHDPRLLTARSRRTLVGVAFSLAVHVVLLAVLALILLDAPVSESRRFGPAVEISSGEANAANESAADAWLDESLPDLASAVPMPEIAFESDTAALSIVAAGAPSPLALSGGAGAGDASGLSLGGAAGGGASFFGVEASGSRIVYIVDISGSMHHGGKMDALKSELLESLSGLPPASEFSVIVFSDEISTRVLGGVLRWRSPSGAGLASVEAGVRALAPSGGTQPLAAFRMAFTLSPKPEAIYFMTDGELPQRDASRIIGTVNQMNRQEGAAAPIHCIAFGSRDGGGDLRRIARQSGGTFTYVPLRSRP